MISIYLTQYAIEVSLLTPFISSDKNVGGAYKANALLIASIKSASAIGFIK